MSALTQAMQEYANAIRMVRDIEDEGAGADD